MSRRFVIVLVVLVGQQAGGNERVAGLGTLEYEFGIGTVVEEHDVFIDQHARRSRNACEAVNLRHNTQR